jgi:hypothetical protein
MQNVHRTGMQNINPYSIQYTIVGIPGTRNIMMKKATIAVPTREKHIAWRSLVAAIVSPLTTHCSGLYGSTYKTHLEFVLPR